MDNKVKNCKKEITKMNYQSKGQKSAIRAQKCVAYHVLTFF